MDRLVRLLAESFGAVTQRQKDINQSVTEKLMLPTVKVEQPDAPVSSPDASTKT